MPDTLYTLLRSTRPPFLLLTLVCIFLGYAAAVQSALLENVIQRIRDRRDHVLLCGGHRLALAQGRDIETVAASLPVEFLIDC